SGKRVPLWARHDSSRAVLRLAAWMVLALACPLAADARVGAVAAEHRFAAEAGAEILRRGGSAVDAAVAAAAAGCVVHASSCGIGGGGFAVGRLAGGGSFAGGVPGGGPGRATQGRGSRHCVAPPPAPPP